MRGAFAVTFAAVVVLAGCSGFFGDAPETTTPTETASGGVPPTETAAVTETATPSQTPPPTPTATETEPPDGEQQLAPGVTREGIVNPVELMSAHQRELLAAGYEINQTVVSTYNGSVSNRLVVHTTAGPGGEIAYQNGTSSGYDADGNETVTGNAMWLNATAMVTRHVEAGSTTYRVQPRLYPPESLIWYSGLQRDIQFAADDYEVTSVDQRDGVRVVTLEAAIDRVDDDDIDDTTSTLQIDENGVIRDAETEVNYGTGNVYHTDYAVERVGSEPPARPAWLDAVPPSASLEMDVFRFDETSAELVHTHGDAAPAGSIVTVVSNGTLYEATLDEPFRDGTLSLWIDADDTLRMTSERPSSDAARELGPVVTVTVRAPDGGELFSTSLAR
ncbi:hypothetical protein Harman_06430 [Haloarcula mannanilytica]|uniref:Uncharacterized protein n=1 Tax=Haloarcula mannanilytica TaxID=2509225 RepID=A0A4C2EDX9_9EURY|nr:hypothetical protein [Haloarcula mannanilytica]GCF12708.1 hypothetical protein Harman_06430 [Haloarcula mannanilytica]